MDPNKRMDIFIQVRKSYNLLGEILDLSRQMAEAMDRDDQPSLRMLLSMRRTPLQDLAVAREEITQIVSEMSPQDADLIGKLLRGNGTSRIELEIRLMETSSACKRLLNEILEIDRKLNLKIVHDGSVYLEEK